MQEQRMAARVRLVEEHLRLENLHDLDGIMRTYGETGLVDDVACGERHEGLEGVRAFYEDLFRAIHDFHMTVKDRHVAGGVIVQEIVVTGIHRGTWKGIPATGRRVEVPVVTIFSFDDRDKLSGERIYFDRATVLMQMGVLPGGQRDGDEGRSPEAAGFAA